MIEEFGKIIEQGVQNGDVNYFGQFVESICKKYDVSEKTVYNRFRSIYGDKPRNIIRNRIIPNTQELETHLVNASSSEEFFDLISVKGNLRIGFYDKVFGVSTFQKAKLAVIGRDMKISYKPTIQDNRSIIYSQILGDGYYDSKRHSLRLAHGIKQADYLRWKVSLIHEAYPASKQNRIVVSTHTQGHDYVSYYHTIGNVDVYSEEQLVSKLTPLGWLLWYLDGGYAGQNFQIACKRNYQVRENAVKELKTYGISARTSDTSVIMKGQQSDMLFYKTFIEPFIQQIPICMHYKCQTEDIVESIVDRKTLDNTRK